MMDEFSEFNKKHTEQASHADRTEYTDCEDHTDYAARYNLAPSKGRYNDDNLRRAQEITSMFPIGEQFENFDYQALQSLQSEWREAERRQYDMVLAREDRGGRVDSRFDSNSSYYSRKHPTHLFRPSRPSRPIRTEFSEKEKAEILSRVMFVGIERAALEAGTSKEIVMHWLQLIDESISELSSEFNSMWSEIDEAAAAEAEAIAGYETEYRRILEHRTHYKKPLEQIIAILIRAEEVGTKQAARELRSTRTDIIRWRRMFPKQIWEQLRQWVKENDADPQAVQTDAQEVDPADAQQINQINMPVPIPTHASVSVPAAEIIIARADEVGDEQAAHEFKISAATMKRLRLQADVQNGQAVRAGHDGHDSSDASDPSDNPSNPSDHAGLTKLKWHTREERLEILARADEIGINGAAAETGICTSTISRWRKELGRHKYVICTPEQKAVILVRADEIGDKGAAAEFNVSVGSIVTWRRKTGQIKHKKYTAEEKAEILARADEIGAKKAAIEFNINVGTVSEWRKEAGRLRTKAYSQEEKAVAVARSNEVGIKQAAAELKISPNTIILWRSKFGAVKRRKSINADERLVIWNRANEVGRLQAAREYGISPVTIGNWDWKYGMKNPPLHGPNRSEGELT